MFDRREIRGFLTGLAAFIALGVILASAPALIPGQPLLQTLRFHLAAVAFFMAVILLIWGARWRGILLILLVGVSLAEGAYWIVQQQNTRPALNPASETTRFELLSFNVLGWNKDGAAVAAAILEQDADVAFILEAAPLWPHLARLQERYPYRVGCNAEQTCDTTIFAKSPLDNGQIRSLSDFSIDRFVTAEIDIGGQTVTLAAVHMTKPYFDFNSEGEARMLRRALGFVEGPVVIAGDFNAAPWSGNLRRLLRNASLMPANGYPATWPTELGPFGVPIDNVFTRAPAIVEAVAALPDATGSNHLGVVATIQLMDSSP